MKIIDKIYQKQQEKEIFISYEYYPPKTQKGLDNLNRRIDMMRESDPLFVDFTWGAGGSTADLTFQLALDAKKKGLEPNMHLTCTNMNVELINETLKNCYESGIENILALRGDPPIGINEWKVTKNGFNCALDLILHIRKQYKDFFCISVAGYPEGHPDQITKINNNKTTTTMELNNSLSKTEKIRQVIRDDGIYVCRDELYKKELIYLKKKVDAGANLIITQMCFDIPIFLSFVQQCRHIGINVPILPGIMCIQSYHGFQRMTLFCKTKVPQPILNQLECIAKDDEKIKQYGIEQGVLFCKQLIDSKMILGLHFYTLNNHIVVDEICRELKAQKKINP